MFDFAWSEIAVIGVVALIAIGPKDMPAAIKAITTAIKKARRMAAEFQTHVDDMLKEANLDEVKKEFNEIRNLNLKYEVERAVDPDGSIRATFAQDPLASTSLATAKPASAESGEVASYSVETLERPSEVEASVEPSPEEEPAEAAASLAPDFIPPALAVPEEPAPEFLPPGVTKQPARAARF